MSNALFDRCIEQLTDLQKRLAKHVDARLAEQKQTIAKDIAHKNSYEK